MNKTISLLLTLALSTCAPQIYQFGVGGHAILCVPRDDINEGALESSDVSTHLLTGNGRTPGVPFLMSADAVRQDIPQFKADSGYAATDISNQLSGEVDFVSDADRRRYGPGMRSPYFPEMWYRKAPCVAPAFTQSGHFIEGRCTADDDDVLLLKKQPSAGMALPASNDFVVAFCTEPPAGARKFSVSNTRTCQRTVILDGFLVDYGFRIKNANLIAEMDSFLLKKIRTWKTRCLRQP